MRGQRRIISEVGQVLPVGIDNVNIDLAARVRIKARVKGDLRPVRRPVIYSRVKTQGVTRVRPEPSMFTT